MPVKAGFIKPMLLLRTDRLPDDRAQWMYELKLDGYPAIGFKANGKLYLRSRNDNDFSLRYPAVVDGLAGLPDDTVIDGEVVAFDGDGRPFMSRANQSVGVAWEMLRGPARFTPTARFYLDGCFTGFTGVP